MTGLMNKCGFAKLAELLQKLIDVTILNSPIDYTAKFDLIIASLQAIDANTDGLEASLSSDRECTCHRLKLWMEEKCHYGYYLGWEIHKVILK